MLSKLAGFGETAKPWDGYDGACSEENGWVGGVEVGEKWVDRQCCSDARRKVVNWMAFREERKRARKRLRFRRNMRFVAGVKKGFREVDFGGWTVILECVS